MQKGFYQNWRWKYPWEKIVKMEEFSRNPQTQPIESHKQILRMKTPTRKDWKKRFYQQTHKDWHTKLTNKVISRNKLHKQTLSHDIFSLGQLTKMRKKIKKGWR